MPLSSLTALPDKALEVQVIYALPQCLTRLSITLPAGSTVRDALNESGFFQHHPEFSFDTLVTGIYGERVSLDHALKPHDRVEIYRPLIMDPKARRRLRHAEKQSLSKLKR